jgi:hypothetical protein
VSELPESFALAGGVASLSADTGGGETLVIPVETDMVIGGYEPLRLHLSGNIVATSVAPEPGAVMLWGGIVPALLRRRRGHGVAGVGSCGIERAGTGGARGATWRYRVWRPRRAELGSGCPR